MDESPDYDARNTGNFKKGSTSKSAYKSPEDLTTGLLEEDRKIPKSL